MCEAGISPPDQVVIFKGDCACLQAINVTAFTTGDLVFMGGKKFLPVGVSSRQNVVRWNSLVLLNSKCLPCLGGNLILNNTPVELVDESQKYVLIGSD